MRVGDRPIWRFVRGSLIHELLRDDGVSGGGRVGEMEDEREVQRVGPDGQGFVQDAVGPDAFEVDSADPGAP